MENYKRQNVYNEDALVLFERYKLTKDDLMAMGSDNPEAVSRHVANIIDRNDGQEEIDWLEFAVSLEAIEPFLAIPFFEELCRRGCPCEANTASAYRDIECWEEASEWYRRAMANSSDELYFSFAEGYIECETAMGNFDNIDQLLLELLDTFPKNRLVWYLLYNVFRNNYRGLLIPSEVVFGCWMMAVKYGLDGDHLKDDIRSVKERQPALYNRAVKLDMPAVARQLLQQHIVDNQEGVEATAEAAADTLTLSVGDHVSPTMCCERLSSMRYEKVPMVYMPGQYAHRGGIIDIFPYQGNVPYRVDWFDDGIETIRTFDSKTMLTTAKCDKVVISAELQKPVRPYPKSKTAISPDATIAL